MIKNTYNFWIPRFHGLLNHKDSTFSIDYPNEVQLYLKEKVKKVWKKIAMSK